MVIMIIEATEKVTSASTFSFNKALISEKQVCYKCRFTETVIARVLQQPLRPLPNEAIADCCIMM